MSLQDAALLLLGHGSTVNADSSAPTYQQAEELRRRHLFADVQVAFWKEEPNFRQALRQTDRPRVYVVPNFISSGYFTEQIIPRELGLAGPVSQLGNQEIILCDPVGLHPSMTQALLQRARQVVAQSSAIISDPSRSACLFICGHGTSFNDNSTKIIHQQAEMIRALSVYADCQGVLMEQTPFVKDWRTLTSCPNVIVVPFFIADGLHSFEDIPVLLGLTHNVKEQGFANPHCEAERRLWYATALGSERFLADVILAQVRQAEERYPARAPSAAVSPGNVVLQDALAGWMKEAPWQIGQVLVRSDFELRHQEDASLEVSQLQLISTVEGLRALVRLDAKGEFRPLRAAPNLARGWRYQAGDLPGLQLALDYLYPAEVANWVLWRENRLPLTPWLETAQRQSGRFRIVRELLAPDVDDLVGAICEPGCLKKRLWAPAQEAIAPVAGELTLLCPEACNLWIGKAREKLKGAGED